MISGYCVDLDDFERFSDLLDFSICRMERMRRDAFAIRLL